MSKSFVFFIICLIYVGVFLKITDFPYHPSPEHKGADMFFFALYMLSFIYAVFYAVVSFFMFPERSRIED